MKENVLEYVVIANRGFSALVIWIFVRIKLHKIVLIPLIAEFECEKMLNFRCD